MPVERSGVLFITTKNGLVYALESESGKILWRYRVDVTIVNTPTPINRDQVLVSTLSGKVILLEHHK
jgi:outer membrane protein assembly factor BamB